MRFAPCLLVAALLTLPAPAQEWVFPGETWSAYATPEDAGFSSERLGTAREYWESTPSAAAMVVYRGAVVAAWGDVERRYMCHSVRKSFLSGLIGAHVADGRIDLEATLAELGIDDQEPVLTDEEKTARVIDLLCARSGVYRLAAYEPPQNPKPPRGSHPPGTFWCYNNWDFNTLLTIFEERTGTRIFEEFGRRFAGPLGMQDYRPRDGYYHYELDKSAHPAYPFRMSARDMARFGLLYLNEGDWNGERVLPSDWVEASHGRHSEDTWTGAYGYMWWVEDREPFGELGLYSALGVGGQSIDVLPGAEMVFVNRTNTFEGHDVSSQQRLELLRLVLDALDGEPDGPPELVPLASRPPRVAFELPPETLRRLCRRFDYGPDVFDATVESVDGGLVVRVDSRGGQSFDLLPVSDVELRVVDMEQPIFLHLDERDPARDLLVFEGPIHDLAIRRVQEGDLDGALEAFRVNARFYPDSARAHESLGHCLVARGDREGALASFERALEIDPRRSEARASADKLERELAGTR